MLLARGRRDDAVLFSSADDERVNQRRSAGAADPAGDALEGCHAGDSAGS